MVALFIPLLPGDSNAFSLFGIAVAGVLHYVINGALFFDKQISLMSA